MDIRARFLLALPVLLSSFTLTAPLAVLRPVAHRSEWLAAYAAFLQSGLSHDFRVQLLVYGQYRVTEPAAGQRTRNELRGRIPARHHPVTGSFLAGNCSIQPLQVGLSAAVACR